MAADGDRADPPEDAAVGGGDLVGTGTVWAAAGHVGVVGTKRPVHPALPRSWKSDFLCEVPHLEVLQKAKVTRYDQVKDSGIWGLWTVSLGNRCLGGRGQSARWAARP